MQTSSGAARGKACDRDAWAHSVSAASLLLDVAKFYEHVGQDHLWEEGLARQRGLRSGDGGPITMDPLTLHIDCAGTIATINGPKRKALGARENKGASEQAPLFPRRGQCSQGQGPCDGDKRASWAFHSLFRRGNHFADVFARKRRRRHTQTALARGQKRFWPSLPLAKQAARWAAEAHRRIRSLTSLFVELSSVAQSNAKRATQFVFRFWSLVVRS